MAQAASHEILLYFSEFLKTGRSWFEFPEADIHYVDGVLAPIYGISTTLTVGTFERVELHDDQRAGFFGLVGFLAVSSLDDRTSPSRRGRMIASDFLCAAPPPPPPSVPMLAGDDAGADGGSSLFNVRQRLQEHRQNPACAGCHVLFDAYGLALEEYDAIGLYRSVYEDGTPVDPSVTLPPSPTHPDGLTFTGLNGLSHAVSTDPKFGYCFANKLLTYGLGRSLTDSDAPHLQQALQEWLTAGQTPSIRRLIHALVSTDAFRLRRGGEEMRQ